MIGVNRPAIERDRDSELIFIISFSSQRQEAQIVVLGKRQQRARERRQRRCLIELTIKGARYPTELRQQERRTQTWTGGIFNNAAGEMGLSHSSHHSDPLRHLECVLDVRGYQSPRWVHSLAHWRIAAVIEEHIEELAVVLAEPEETDMQVIGAGIETQALLAAQIGGGTLISRADGKIIGCAVQVGAVVVIQQRTRKHRIVAELAPPGGDGKRVGFALNLGCPVAWGVGNVVM